MIPMLGGIPQFAASAMITQGQLAILGVVGYLQAEDGL